MAIVLSSINYRYNPIATFLKAYLPRHVSPGSFRLRSCRSLGNNEIMPSLLHPAALILGINPAFAGDKLDVSFVITKADAEMILGVPVMAPSGPLRDRAFQE
jgi:hypothetical protein